MSVTIFIERLDPGTGQTVSREALLTTPQVLALAKILSVLLPELHRVAQPEIQYLAACFLDYLRVDSDLHEREFEAFYEEAMAAGKRLLSTAADDPDDDEDAAADPSAPHADGLVDPEVRVFLGRLLFSGEIITPALAHQMTPFLGLLCGLLSQYQTQARREQPALVGPLRFAYRTMSAIAVACDHALEQSAYLRLAPGPSAG